VLLALFAKRMMVVVIPVIIALLLATLLSPLAHWLGRKGARPALAAALAVLVAFLVFVGLLGARHPAVREPGARRRRERAAGCGPDRRRRPAARPLGKEVQSSIRKARDSSRAARSPARC
jgi:hypothetical protein